MKFKYLLIAAMLFVPGLANAYSVLNPLHGNAWDLYVFGNGRIVYDILMSVRMLMVPDAGHTGFTTLLVLLATLGFLVMAVAAGFDPGKNLLKMFQYIFVVWMVSLFSTTITANLNINDLVVNRDGVAETYTIENVPAMVALPAALTSDVGYYFTKVIETYFTTPDEFKVTGSGAGQFNLFAKMVEESGQYGFQYPELKQSMSAYTADCVVPALAMGRLQGPGVDSAGNAQTLTGLNALTHSTNLMQTYTSAQHNAIMTTYYPINEGQYQSQCPNGSAVGAMGCVMSCQDAFTQVTKDMSASAQALMDKGTQAWAKTGILVPYETAMRTMLAQAAANGSKDANFTSPNGYILQQSMLNQMSGSFRQAAIQTGNNEAIQAANISQAEASQISGWVAAFSTFNNMMGYVFTTLQAFIFAITPMIVVALLIPGLGRSMFANYAQILVWLTLWMPTLALINYIITQLGADSTGVVVGMEGGISWHNKALFDEKAKNAVVAAQFLGTMTPMITWSIVKGAMGFTEFISHGVGSQFASSAGANAASGVVNMNNMSMDNASMSKYNTAFSSTVGFQSTNAFAGAGALNMSHDLGGQNASMNGKSVDAGQSLSQGLSERQSESASVRATLQAVKNHQISLSDAISRAESDSNSTGSQRVVQTLKSIQEQAQRSAQAGASSSTGTTGASGDSTGQDNSSSRTTEAHAGVSGKVSGGVSVLGNGAIVSADAGMSTRAAGANSDKSAHSDQLTQNAQTGNSAGTGVSTSKTGLSAVSDTTTQSGAHSHSVDTRSSHDQSAAYQQSISDALAREEAYSKSLDNMMSVAKNYSVASGMTAQGTANLLSEIDSLHSQMAAGAGGITSQMDGIASGLSQRQESVMGQFNGGYGHGGVGAGPAGPSSNVGADADAFRSQVGNQVAADSQKVHSSATAGQDNVRKANVKNHVSGSSIAAMAGGSPLLKQMSNAGGPNANAPVPTVKGVKPHM
ncbi:conjugal transfer protein TraG N-terminal domain-containing protein [Burkholderia cenocepacia]|uniref:conjugal transfer protein TraG N-terminal domain-containing protein n=1 Tax=Burkholderia cenocepacia TaxID=95486 RepID=UPI0007620412|nr:conjugal transfer protein TraG N-terminal domain-containing protein [Burkholderia cenocepacia]KWU17827.1 hypothetical protein AS149_13990 [Burkholderia cenocepacia]